MISKDNEKEDEVRRAKNKDHRIKRIKTQTNGLHKKDKSKPRKEEEGNISKSPHPSMHIPFQPWFCPSLDLNLMR